jgi:hypothetical protein
MVDISTTIEADSKQLNAIDLIAGSRTIKVTGVKVLKGDQPVAISYEGDNGKPYMPCKSMRRVLAHCWSTDGNKYVGRSMTLYNDPDVTWAGQKVGGIRISHMSDIKGDVTVSLTASKMSKKPFTVKPLKSEAPAATNPPKPESNPVSTEDEIDVPAGVV